jgi:predicted nucleotidyltransferase
MGELMPGQLASRHKKGSAGKSSAEKKLIVAAPAIRRKFGVTKIGLFGSFARGEQTKKSDVDVLVDFAPGCATLHNFIGLSDYLEALFKRNVDLLTEPSLSDLIRPYIEQDVIWIEG